jgi:HK97 family phage major capsid protein/HK97 family phage prohead protease
MTKRDMRHGMCERTVEFRATEPPDEGGDGRTMEGHFAVFNTPTRISSPYEGTFDEVIHPGAFRKTISEKQPIVQFQHGHDARVGGVPIASIEDLKEDGKGLFMRARLFDNDLVKPVGDAIRGGALNGASFRFSPVRDQWTDARGNEVDDRDELESLLFPGRSVDTSRLPLTRHVREVRLHELGPVVGPAYETTSISARSDEEIELARAELMEQYARTMIRVTKPDTAELERLRKENEELRLNLAVADEALDLRSGADDGDNDEDDTLLFDHFASDIPVREDGLPDVEDSEYDADEESGRAAKDPSKPYGKVTYADNGLQADGKSRYPLDSADHVKAAWSYINMPKNAAKYSSGDLAKVKSAIKSAASKFGISISDDSSDKKKSEMKSAEATGAVREDTPDPNTDDAAREGTSSPEDTRKVAHMPKTKEQLVERNQEILESLAAFEVDEETRDAALDDDKQKEFDDLVAEREANDKSLANIKARQDKLRELAGNAATTERDSRTPAFHQRTDYFDVDALRARGAGNLERTRDLMVDAAKRAIDDAKFSRAPKNYKGAQSGDVVLENLEAARVGTKNGEMHLAERILVTGTDAYRRAFEKIVMHQENALFRMTEDERDAVQRAMTLGTDTQGGYAVPFQLDPTVILTSAGVVNPLRDLARLIKITGKTWEAVTSAGTTATRGAEGAVAPDSSFTLAQPSVSTNRVQAFIPFTYEIDLSWGDLSSEITKQIVDAKKREENSFVTGDGTGTNPFGLLGWTNGGTFGQSGSATTVLTATTSVFSSTDVYSTDNALNPRWEDGASWLAHKGTYNDIRQVDTAGGAELWARIGDGRPDELLDYPVYRSSAMTSSHGAASGTNIAVLGDFDQFVIVDRLGMQVELVPQVFDPTTGRPTGQRGVYAIWMNNSKRIVDDAFRVLQVK